MYFWIYLEMRCIVLYTIAKCILSALQCYLICNINSCRAEIKWWGQENKKGAMDIKNHTLFAKDVDDAVWAKTTLFDVFSEHGRVASQFETDLPPSQGTSGEWPKVWILYGIFENFNATTLSYFKALKAILRDLLISAPSMYIFTQQILYRLHKSIEHQE